MEKRSRVSSPVLTSTVQISKPPASSQPSLFSQDEFPSLSRNVVSQKTTGTNVASTSQENNGTRSSDNSDNQRHTEGSVTISNNVPISTSQHSMVTRSKDGIRKPNPKYALLAHRLTDPLPTTVTAALKDPRWNNAMGEEFENCTITKTWSLVPRTPEMHVLGNQWIYRYKLKADGMVKSHRARLVAHGNKQEEGIDYLETYSPVVRTTTVRTVLHLATIMKWEVKQMDIKNAFMHGDLLETVYMKQPAGFVDKTKPDHVCHLHKS